MLQFVVGFMLGGAAAVFLLGIIIVGTEEDHREERTRK